MGAWWLLAVGLLGWYLSATYPKRPDWWVSKWAAGIVQQAGVALVAYVCYSAGRASVGLP